MGLIQGISRSIINLLPGGIVVSNRDSILKRTIAAARKALNIHPEQQTGSAYLVQKTPTIAGFVEDETPARKDRTRLSCRATDFDGINQSFSGGNTSTGKTALSAAIWCRPTDLTGIQTLLGEYNGAASQVGWLIYFNAGKIKLEVSEDGGTVNRKTYVSQQTFLANDWIHVCTTMSLVGGLNEVLVYVNGKEIAVSKTSDPDLSGIHDSTEPFQIADYGGGSDYFTGQLQQPLIYQGIWTPAQVRDLYLQQTDDIPTTYGWFLDGDSASGLTSSSPALAASNSPDIYESDEIGGGDWLNEKGWNPVTKFDGDLITITDGLEVDFSKDVKIKMSVNYTPLTNNSELFEFAPNKNARTYFGTRLLWVLTGTSDVTTTGGDPTFTSNVWYDLEFNFVASSGTMTISVNDVVKATLAGQSPAAIQTLNNIGGGSTPLTALVSGFEVYENDIKIFRLDGLVDSVGGLPLTIGAGISELNYPKRWNEELDSAGQPAANSDSFGVARRDGQLVDGNCISLDGVNQYGTLPSEVSAVLSESNSFTASIDFVTNAIGAIQILISNGISANDRFACQVHSDGTIRAAIYDGGFNSKSGGSIVAGEVNTLVCSWDGVTFLAWLNGVELTETNGPTVDQSGGLKIGSRAATVTSLFDGQLWNLKIYNSSIAAISDLDSLTATHQYPMAEGSGSVSYDVSGNGKNCTWTNSPDWGNQSQYFWNENQGCDVVGTFDGVDDYIQGAAVAMSSEMTLTFWGKYDFSIGSAPWSLICNRVDADNGISISSNGEGNNFFTFRLAGTNYSTNLSLSGLFGDWAHYSIILSAGTVTVYRNNAAVTPQSSAASGIPADVGFFIGKRNTNYSPSGTQIHSARVYSKALTADERTHVYTDGASGTDPTLTDCLLKYDIDEGSGLTVADSSGNGNDGTINGATSDEFWGTIIPAASDGTSLIRATPSNPAGPWLYEGLGSTYVNFDVVPNANQWLEQRWIGAEFDGVSSSTLLSGNFDWSQSFDISLNYRLADHALAEYLFCNSNTLVYSLRTSGGRPQFRNGGTTFMYSQAGSLTDFNDLRVTYTGGQTGDIEITLNGVTETFTNDAGSPPASNQIRFGSDGAVSAFTEGEIRTLAVTNGASDYYDSPLLGCSLDLSSQVNHGTDTDVVYNRLTDVSYQAGDTVEQPFSVNDDTAGRVSELIQFTFPKV